MFLYLVLCGGATLFSLFHVPEKSAPDFRILVPGTFHGWEIKSVGDGDAWLGLFHEESGWMLRAVAVETRPALDPYLDRDSTQTARQVFVPGVGPDPAPGDWDFARCPEADGQPVFLLQPPDGFPEGPLTTVCAGSEDIVSGMVIPLGDGDTRLVTSGKALYLEAGGMRQCLGELYPDSHGESIRLIWAGDIDGDGLLDLVLDDSFHYAVRLCYRLFLSGGTRQGTMVREVAAFTAVGC